MILHPLVFPDLPHHLKVKGLITATTSGTGSEKVSMNVLRQSLDNFYLRNKLKSSSPVSWEKIFQGIFCNCQTELKQGALTEGEDSVLLTSSLG